MQTDVTLGQVADKRPIKPNETVPIIKIGEREPALEDEVSHQYRNASAGAAPSIFVSDGDAATLP
jgi:hypothetical protein